MEKELFLEPSKELDARFSALQEEFQQPTTKAVGLRSSSSQSC